MKHSKWALQDAKNRFSEVVNRAEAEGSQLIRGRGQDTITIVSLSDYNALSGQKGSLVDLLRASPSTRLNWRETQTQADSSSFDVSS